MIAPTEQQSQIQKLVIPSHGWIHDFVNVYHGHLETPDEALAGIAYTVLSAVVGWRAQLRWADYSEPLTLYTVLVGGSATAHKTSVLRIGERITREANESFRQKVGATEETPDLVRVISGGHMSQAALLDKVGPADEEMAERWNDPSHRIPSFLICWDEMTDLVVKSKQPQFMDDTRQMLLRMYGGYQPGSQTRSNPVPASRCSVALVGTITTQDWVEQMSESAVTGGMLGRMLALPMGLPPGYIPLPKPVEPSARNRLVNWLADLGASTYPDWGHVNLDTEATELWQEWYLAHKNRIAEIEKDDAPRALATGALFGRYQATALKFAGLQALSTWLPDSRQAPPTLVTADVLSNACNYIDLTLTQATNIATDALEPEEERFIRRVMALLEKHTKVTLTELQQKVRVKGIGRERCHRLLDLMHQEGMCMITKEPHHTVRGDRTRIWIERS